jgi:hypothetical protein
MFDYWLNLILVALLIGVPVLIVLGGLPVMLVALYEKRYVRNYALLDTGGKLRSPHDPGPHPYMDSVNEEAGQMGFEFGGIYVRATKGAAKFRVAVWRSPERDILVRVTIVKAGPLQQKLTTLVSQVGSRYLITADDFSEDDISGMLDYEVRLNAHFPELLKLHEDRLARADDTVVYFVAENMVEDLDSIQLERARHMIKLGYARFRDDEQSVWSYTVKGAMHLYFRSYFKQILRALPMFHRQWHRRPGS